MKDIMPRRESELIDWLERLSRELSLDPAAYGVPVPVAAEMAQRYAAAREAMDLTGNLATRTRLTVSRKRDALHAAVATARQVNRLVQANPAATAAQKLALGLNPTANIVVGGRRLNPPTVPPQVRVKHVRGCAVTVLLLDDETARRVRAANTTGAVIFSHVGDAPPTNGLDWHFEATTTACEATLHFPYASPGDKVWVAAWWLNSRLEPGPFSKPAHTHLQLDGWHLPTGATAQAA